jgi:hypothetical protein
MADEAIDTIDGGANAGTGDSNADPARRGRRARKTAAADAGIQAEIVVEARKTPRRRRVAVDLAPALALVSQAMASAARIPDLALSDAESRALSDSTVSVLTEYEIMPPSVSGRVGALISLVTTAIIVAVPRVLLVLQVREARRAQAARAAETVASRTTNGAEPANPYAAVGLSIGA